MLNEKLSKNKIHHTCSHSYANNIYGYFIYPVKKKREPKNIEKKAKKLQKLNENEKMIRKIENMCVRVSESYKAYANHHHYNRSKRRQRNNYAYIYSIHNTEHIPFLTNSIYSRIYFDRYNKTKKKAKSRVKKSVRIIFNVFYSVHKLWF